MNIIPDIQFFLYLIFLYKFFSIYNKYFNIVNNVKRLLYEGILFVDDELFDERDLKEEALKEDLKEEKKEEKKVVKY